MDLSGIILASARKHNLDPNLINAVVQQESSGNPTAWNKGGGGQGAAGAMQVRAPALSDYNAANGTKYTMQDLTNPQVGVDVGSWYLGQQLDRFNDPRKAVAAYKDGAGSQQAQTGNSPYAQQVFGRLNMPQKQQQPTSLPGIPVMQQSDAQGADPFSSLAVDGQTKAAAAAPSNDPFSSLPVEGQQSPANTPQTRQEKSLPAQQPTSATSDFLSALGHHLMSPLHGGAQLVEHGVNAGVQALAGGTPFANYVQGIVNSDDAALRQREQQYQQSVPNNAASYTGAAIGEVLPALAVGGGSLLTKGSQVGSDLAVKLGLGGLGTAVAKGAGSAAAGAALGGAYSSLQPVNDAAQNLTSLVTGQPSDSYWQQKAGQIGSGALLGAATPALTAGLGKLGQYAGNLIGSTIRPFTESGRAQIAQDVISQAARGGPTGLDLSQIVPGSSPTLAEATGNPGIATLQRTIRDINPAPFVAREQQNAASRLSQMQGALGSPEELQAAESAARQVAGDLGGAIASNGVGTTPGLNAVLSRPAMAQIVKDAEKTAINTTGVNPFQSARDALAAQRVAQFQGIAGSPAALDAAKAAREAAADSLYSQANGQTFTSDKTLGSLLQRPSMQQAIARAQKLASERGQPLQIGKDIPETSITTPSLVLNAEGNPAFTTTSTIPGQNAKFSGRALNYIKMGLDDLISSGSQTGGIIGHEKGALNDTKGAFLNWMDSKSPIYQKARQTYASMSSPINAMETLQGLNLTDANGSIVPSKLDSAIKSIQSAQKEPGINPAKAVTAQQLSALNSLRSSVNSDKASSIPQNLGPAAIGHIQTEITNALNGGKVLAPETQASLKQAQSEILGVLQKQNPQTIGTRSQVPASTAAGGFVGPVTLPQQAEIQAQSAQSLKALQGMNLTDASGNVTLAKVQNALKSLQKQGLLADPQKMAALVSVRDDLLRSANTELGKTRAGSATAQNIATQQMLRAALPGKLGALAGQLPGGSVGAGLGALLGYGAGGPAGAALGTAAGGKLGSIVTGLANARNEAIQDEVARLLLNPSIAAPALNRATRGALPSLPSGTLQRLINPSVIGLGVGSLNRPAQ